jgi:hypothetical protein
MGSPLVWGSTRVFSASSIVGWFVVVVFLPPPFLRLLPIGGGLARQTHENLVKKSDQLF